MRILGTRTVSAGDTVTFDTKVEDVRDAIELDGHAVVSITPFFQPDTNDSYSSLIAVIVYGEREDGDA